MILVRGMHGSAHFLGRFVWTLVGRFWYQASASKFSFMCVVLSNLCFSSGSLNSFCFRASRCPISVHRFGKVAKCLLLQRAGLPDEATSCGAECAQL